MTDTELYDAIVVVTPNDFKRVESNNKRIVDYLPVRKVLFVGSKELGELVAQSSLGDKAGFVDENDIIPFDDVYNYVRYIAWKRIAKRNCWLVLSAIPKVTICQSMSG